MAENKTLVASNTWQIERAKFEERHPEQRILLRRIEESLNNNINHAILLLNDASFAIREVERKANEKKD